MATTTPTKPAKATGRTTPHDGTPPTLTDRAALGKTARAEVPRSTHAQWMAGDDRDPQGILAARTCLACRSLCRSGTGRMLASPFAFFRGAAAVMAADLAPTPVSGLRAQACGDAHLSNFGVFAAPERTLVFDINDFDETLPGPWEWDVKRLAASFVVAGRERVQRQAARMAAPPGRALPQGDAGLREAAEPRRRYARLMSKRAHDASATRAGAHDPRVAPTRRWPRRDAKSGHQALDEAHPLVDGQLGSVCSRR